MAEFEKLQLLLSTTDNRILEITAKYINKTLSQL